MTEPNNTQSPMPSIGRVVHFHPDANMMMFKGQDVCAAIVTKVHSPSEVDLTVFGNGHMAPTCFSNVSLRKEEKGLNTWSWPPRV